MGASRPFKGVGMDYQKVVVELSGLIEGWFYHSIKSVESNYYLHNRAGLYIRFNLNDYGYRIPQVSICYEDPRATAGERLIQFKKIGCSLDKSIPSIASMIESRLFIDLGVVQQEQRIAKEKQQKKMNERVKEKQVIDVLSKLYTLEKSTNSRVYPTYDLGKDEKSRMKIEQLGCMTKFNVSIQSVTIEDMIKIANIIYD